MVRLLLILGAISQAVGLIIHGHISAHWDLRHQRGPCVSGTRPCAGSRVRPHSTQLRAAEGGGDDAPQLDEQKAGLFGWDGWVGRLQPSEFLKGVGLGVTLALIVPFLVIVTELKVSDDPSAVSGSQVSIRKKSLETEVRESSTLFDAILTDLRLGYVDTIDPKKLFETAVGAMLRSLDPYTEFENIKASRQIQESVSGKYGGVGLVITNEKAAIKVPSNILQPTAKSPFTLPAVEPAPAEGKPPVRSASKDTKDAPGNNGVMVVDTFETYAFQSGMRVGDHIRSVDGIDTSKMGVEGVRDLLRGDPETSIRVTFEREEYGGKKMYDLTLQRRQVKLSDVRLACFLGDRRDRIGYINLAGFNAGAGRDFRTAFLMLKYLALDELPAQQASSAPGPDGAGATASALAASLSDELAQALQAYQAPTPTHAPGMLALSGPIDAAVALASASPNAVPSIPPGSSLSSGEARAATPSPHGPGLAGLVLDLRGNPGGLLDAAVEIASYLVPAQSDIVSARSRDAPEILYRSVIDPIRTPATRLVVLVNGGSASASEIVAGAIQDLDAGVVVGQSKTYGKGLVQKIVPLPYDSALKYTIAKYYTPSGRCIQSINYSGGRQGGESEDAPGAEQGEGSSEAGAADSNSFLQSDLANDGATTIQDSDRKTFLTASGRPVLDGGGINPDILVPPNELSPAEALFLREGLYSRYISDYIQSHDVLPELHGILLKEAQDRNNERIFPPGAFGSAVEQFLVYDRATPAQVKAQDKILTRYNSDLYSGFRAFVLAEKRENKLGFKLGAVGKLEEIEKVRSRVI